VAPFFSLLQQAFRNTGNKDVEQSGVNTIYTEHHLNTELLWALNEIHSFLESLFHVMNIEAFHFFTTGGLRLRDLLLTLRHIRHMTSPFLYMEKLRQQRMIVSHLNN